MFYHYYYHTLLQESEETNVLFQIYENLGFLIFVYFTHLLQKIYNAILVISWMFNTIFKTFSGTYT